MTWRPGGPGGRPTSRATSVRSRPRDQATPLIWPLWTLESADPAALARELRAVDYEPPADIVQRCREIIARVADRGDAALIELGRELDGVRAAGYRPRVPAEALAAALRDLDPALRAALERAVAQVRAYHEHQRLPAPAPFERDGIRLRWRTHPLASAGLYVPGGSAAYPSTVYMNAVAAQVAGVGRIALCSPPRADGLPAPVVLAVCGLLGIGEVYAIGGAQAIAALALGSESVAPVDLIAGPGNVYVDVAKRLLATRVGLDLPAGPTEVLILAGPGADPADLAADLLAQAEHDTRARPLLLSWSAPLIEAVRPELERQLALLPRAPIAAAALREGGGAIVSDGPEAALRFAEAFAPEHLELIGAEAEALVDRVRSAGAVFLGRASCEPVGDYVAGPSHTLPTGGHARHASGLGLHSFLRHDHVVEMLPEGLARWSAIVQTLARAEGLEGHARSMARRNGFGPSSEGS